MSRAAASCSVAAWPLLAGLASVAAIQDVRAQQSAENAVATAMQLQDSGKWTEGRDLLAAQLDNCASATEPRPCRVLLTRALGYTYQHQAQRDVAQRLALLSQAVAYYQGALQEDSSDGTIVANLALAYRTLGRGADLEHLLRAAIERGGGDVGFYWLLLGDHYERRRAWDSALRAYRGAIAAAPGDEAPRRRLVDLYRRLPRDSVAGLYGLVSQGSDWEARFPDASARAYELVIQTADSTTSVQACQRWVLLLANTQLLTVERLDAVDRAWLASDVRELKAFMSDPQLVPTGALWQTGDRREARGRLSLALGRRWLAAGDPRKAEQYWQLGMEAANGPPAAPVSLDLAIETAALYQRHPSLDSSGARRDSSGPKFRRIERSLFEEKGRAYELADQEAIQRLHTVLGLIYTQRGVWKSPTPWTNAAYQLEHALATARARDSVSGSYQPLPQLRSFLAQGYSAIDRPDTARATFANAAQAYLDEDQLGRAEEMLARARAIAGPSPERVAQLSALAAVIDARAVAVPTERPTGDECDAAAERTARLARAAGLDTGFLKRQRFKLLADCVLAGPAPVRPGDAARVLTTMVDEKVPLVGAGDLVRYRRSQAAVSRMLRSPDEPGRPDADQSKVRPRGPALRLQLSTESRPTYIPLRADGLVGAHVLRRLGADPVVRNVRVSQGAVTVATGEVNAADQARIQTRLQGVPGLRSAQVRTTDSPKQPAPPLDLEAARRQVGDLRKSAVVVGATDEDLAAGDSASNAAASLLAGGNAMAALERFQKAMDSYARGARDAQRRTETRRQLEQQFRAARAEAIERRIRTAQTGTSLARLAAGDATMRRAEQLMAQGNASAALEQVRAAAVLWAQAAEAPANPRAELEAIIATYARALETRSIDTVRRVVSDFDAGALQALFRRADRLQVQLEVASVDVQGDRARVVVRGVLEYRDKTRAFRREKLEQRAMFVRVPVGWRMASIR